jgi:hypothetical protein
VKVNVDGLITVTFTDPLVFEADWIKATNKAKTSKQPRLALKYKNGFKGTKDFTKNELKSWEVTRAEDN